eukprot:273828-Chlamydomonas_euryale.AAC.9
MMPGWSNSAETAHRVPPSPGPPVKGNRGAPSRRRAYPCAAAPRSFMRKAEGEVRRRARRGEARW